MLPFIFSFFFDFLFYYSFYVSYFVSNGMSADKLAILFVAMNASKMITDIPVGLLSDRISRRNMLIIGILFRCLFCLLCISSNNLIVFILSMVIVGIGNSCLWTHTWNYFYDYLKEKGKQGNFSYFMGKFYAISNTAIALAGFTGPYIYSKFDFNGIFILSIFSMIIAIFVITQMPNYKPKKTIKTAVNLKISNPINLISLISVLVKKPKIMRLLILTILMDAMFIVFLDMNTTIMNNLKIDPQSTSQIVGFIALIRIFSNYFSGKTEKFMSFKFMHSSLLVLMSISIVLSFMGGKFMVFVVSTYLCIYPFFDTSIKTKLEHKIDSNTRATIMSMASLLVSIMCISFNGLIGFISQHNGYFASPICIFLIVMLILFMARNIMLFYRADKNIRSVAKNGINLIRKSK